MNTYRLDWIERETKFIDSLSEDFRPPNSVEFLAARVGELIAYIRDSRLPEDELRANYREMADKLRTVGLALHSDSEVRRNRAERDLQMADLAKGSADDIHETLERFGRWW